MPNTDSEDRILKTVRTRLLTFVPVAAHPVGGTNTLRQRLGTTASGAGSDGKLYISQAPDPALYPYGLLRWLPGRTAGDDGGFQTRLQAELMLYHYERKNEPIISAMMDVAAQAWRDYVATATDDTIVAQRITVRGIVPYEAPADRELVCGRMLLPMYATPYYQAQYSAPIA